MSFTRRFARPAGIALCLALWLGALPARAVQSEPLEVPGGALPAPEAGVLDFRGHLESAVVAWRERGYQDLPVLAWASLRASRDQADPELALRAAELAPSVPAIRLEAALQTWSPSQALAALRAFAKDFPSLAWLMTLSGAALGGAVLLATAVFIVIAFCRTLGLLGHGLMHLSRGSAQPAWCGVLWVLSCLAVLSLLGIGPLTILALAGLCAMVYLPRGAAVTAAAGLALSGALLGPPLAVWASLATVEARDAGLVAAWRAERGQPLPGDLERLDWALRRRPGDPLLSIGAASTWKRLGELDRVEQALAALDPRASAVVQARADNLLGIAMLARGEVDAAIVAFRKAGTAQPSAVYLYNLSQAYGRALRLADQSTLFEEATQLAPELVANYTRFEGKNVHRFLIDAPLPVSAYVNASLVPSEEGTLLATKIRGALLGTWLPNWGWLLLPVLGLLGLGLRQDGLVACGRCFTVSCARCDVAPAHSGLCARCQRTHAPDAATDAAVRAWQSARVRDRQSRLRVGLAALAVLIPGAAAVFEGRSLRGLARVLPLAAAVALCFVGGWVPAPAEIGPLLVHIPAVLGLGLVGLLYAASLREAALRIRATGDRA